MAAFEDFKEMLLRITNHCWLEAEGPEEWKKIKIMPIVTPGKDLYDIKSYRLRLLRSLSDKKIIPEMSMGFKKGERATNCINEIVNSI
jgi:hypothetical protein